jgi:hypothetical protein
MQDKSKPPRGIDTPMVKDKEKEGRDGGSGLIEKCK